MSEQSGSPATADFLSLPTAPEVVVEQDWQRLDRRTVIVAPLGEIVGLLGVAFIILVIRGFSGLRWWEIGIGTVAAVGLVVFGITRWFTTQYRITADHVELHTGLLFRKERAVARDRLRTVDATADVFHRIFGLSVVKVGTGRKDAGTEDELTLDAVSAAEAARLREILLQRKAATVETAAGIPQAEALSKTTSVEDRAEELSALDPRWLRFAPFTLFGLIAVGAIGAAIAWLTRTLDIDVAHSAALRWVVHWVQTTPLIVVIGAVCALLLVLSVLGSLVVYVLSYWNYRLTRHPDGTLRVHYGLLTLRSVSLEENRIRGIELHEPILLRLVRGASCTAVATGLGTGQDSGTLLPPAPLAEAHRVAAQVLQVPESPTQTPLRGHPRVALRPILLWNCVGAAVPIVILGVLGATSTIPQWIWQVALVLIPLSVLYSFAEYRGLGHALTDRYLVRRGGAFTRNTVALQRSGIIGWTIRQSIFQRRNNLITISATTATTAGVYHVRYLDTHDGLTLGDNTIPDLLTPFLEHQPH